MGVGWGQNLFKQHRCSRRECESAALHPVVGSQIRHEWKIFVEGVEAEIMDIDIWIIWISYILSAVLC